MPTKKMSLTHSLKGSLVEALDAVDSPMVSSPASPKTRQGKSLVGGHFPTEVHRQFKATAAMAGLTVQDALTEAINDWFIKHGKPPLA